MFEVAVLMVASIVNILLGMTVYLKNQKSATGRLFLWLTINFVVWSTVNYISLHPVGLSQVVWVRLVLFFAAPLCLAVCLTCITFPAHSLQGSKRFRRFLCWYTAFIMLLVLTPAIFHIGADGKPTARPAILLFTLLIVTLLSTGFISLIRKIRRTDRIAQNQAKLMLLSLATTMGLIILSNFVLVVVFDLHAQLSLGPAYTLIFSGTIAYAIVKHRLFDIRAAVSRSVAYLLIVLTMALLYGVLLFGVVNVLFPGSDKEFLRQVISVILVVPLAVSFQSIKLFFDRITSQIFYRTFYEPQQVLYELSTTLVHAVDTKTITTESSNVLRKAIPATSLEFWLKADEAEHEHEHSESLQLLGKLYQSTKADDVIIIDEYPRHPEIIRQLRDQNVAALVRLRTNSGDLGFMTLSFKSSGEMYSEQDVRLLRISADEIAISLQNAVHFEAIQRFNATLQDKIQQSTRELRHTNEKLRALDETKDDFISMASHQLRTPLTSVKGYLSMVIEGDAGEINETQRKMLSQAYTSSQRMVYLIADLLNVSRLKTGKFVLESAPTELSKMIDEEIGQLTETAAARSLTLNYDKPVDFPTLMLDETKTRQVLMNFIDNAIYYTPKDGHITIELKDTGPTVEFRVIDDGIGVPKSEQHHLFTKFYRAGNARKARPDGTGLGLFMAKKVITAQNGVLIFDSKEDKGSTFGFIFDKAKLAAAEAEVAKEAIAVPHTPVQG
jgi:signal transduction histidine kinase